MHITFSGLSLLLATLLVPFLLATVLRKYNWTLCIFMASMPYQWTELEHMHVSVSTAKSWLTGKDPDAGKDWGQEEKGLTEDEMVGWHHWLNGHEFEQALRVGEGQGSLACWNPWGLKESDKMQRLNNNTANELLLMSLISSNISGYLLDIFFFLTFLIPFQTSDKPGPHYTFALTQPKEYSFKMGNMPLNNK